MEPDVSDKIELILSRKALKKLRELDLVGISSLFLFFMGIFLKLIFFHISGKKGSVNTLEGCKSRFCFQPAAVAKNLPKDFLHFVARILAVIRKVSKNGIKTRHLLAFFLVKVLLV